MNPRICLLCGLEYTPIHGMQKVCRSCRDRYRNSRRNTKKDALRLALWILWAQERFDLGARIEILEETKSEVACRVVDSEGCP